MSFIYRCSKCRTRNTFKKAVVNYTPVRGLPPLTGTALKKELKAHGAQQCKHCGYAHFYIDRERLNRVGCRCSGFHFPHRLGSSYCAQSKRSDLLRAIRDGATPSQIMELSIDLAWETRGIETKVCPF